MAKAKRTALSDAIEILKKLEGQQHELKMILLTYEERRRDLTGKIAHLTSSLDLLDRLHEQAPSRIEEFSRKIKEQTVAVRSLILRGGSSRSTGGSRPKMTTLERAKKIKATLEALKEELDEDTLLL